MDAGRDDRAVFESLQEAKSGGYVFGYAIDAKQVTKKAIFAKKRLNGYVI